MTVRADDQIINPSAKVILFELDATPLGGSILRFVPQVNELGSSVIWQGNTYTPWPLDISGLEWSGTGPVPRPTMIVSNYQRLITGLCLTYDDLVGAKITRHMTLAKYLDAVNFKTALNTPGAIGDKASTPDSPVTSFTDSLDIRVKMSAPDWTPASDGIITAKADADPDRAYLLWLQTTGNLLFQHSADGTVANLRNDTSSVAVGAADGSTKWVRVTYLANNGSNLYETKFFTSDDYDPNTLLGTWTQLGTTVTGTAETIKDTAGTLCIGARSNGTLSPLAAKFYYVEYRRGINGPVVAVMNPKDWITGASWTSSRGEVWSLGGAASILGVNPTADPVAEWPVEIYYVNRKVREDRMSIEFELSSAFDVEGVRLPRRYVIQNVCPWVYRSAECSYAGGAAGTVADVDIFSHALLPGTANNYLSAPDSSSTSPTGDIDVRARIRMNDWTPSTINTIIAKHNTTSNQQAFRFFVNTNGTLQLNISGNGSTEVGQSSGVATGFVDGTTHWVRATRASGTGAINYYTSDDGFAWTQLGTANLASAAGGIFDSTALLEVGSRQSGTSEVFAGRILYADLRKIITGPPTAKFDPSVVADLSTSFISGTGETWTVHQSGIPSAVVRNDLANDVCGLRIASCKLRFGNNSPLPYGGFPSVGLL